MTFQLDENNEIIISVKNKFLSISNFKYIYFKVYEVNKNTKIDNIFNDKKQKAKNKNNETNLYKVIYLLSEESLYQ